MPFVFCIIKIDDRQLSLAMIGVGSEGCYDREKIKKERKEKLKYLWIIKGLKISY